MAVINGLIGGHAGFTITTADRQFALGDCAYGSDGSAWVYVQANGAITGDGYVCTIDEDWQAYMLTTSNDAEGDILGVADVAFADNDYGWLQIKGVCGVLVAANCAANTRINATATAGQLDDDGTAGAHEAWGIWLTTACGGSAAVTAAVLNFPVLINPATTGAETFSGTVTFTGSIQAGDDAAVTIGFYGATPVAQPASASQAAYTITAVTAIGTTTLSAANTSAVFAFASSTAGNALVTRVDQMQVDMVAVGVLLNQIRSELVTLGLLKGSA
jgi:hypothetical protein